MTPATLLRAAALLEGAAESLARSETIGADGVTWPNYISSRIAKEYHDEMLAVAAELRKGALLQPVA